MNTRLAMVILYNKHSKKIHIERKLIEVPIETLPRNEFFRELYKYRYCTDGGEDLIINDAPSDDNYDVRISADETDECLWIVYVETVRKKSVREMAKEYSENTTSDY